MFSSKLFCLVIFIIIHSILIDVNKNGYVTSAGNLTTRTTKSKLTTMNVSVENDSTTAPNSISMSSYVNTTSIKNNSTEGLSINDTKTDDSHMRSIRNFLTSNKGALQRTFYVLIGVSSLIVIYFVIRAVRLRRKRNKSRKYGVISSNKQAAMEMEPLDNSDDDDDEEVTTLFEAKTMRRHR